MVDWADNNAVEYEMLIEMPLGSVEDSEASTNLTLVGLDSFESIRTVSFGGNAPAEARRFHKS